MSRLFASRLDQVLLVNVQSAVASASKPSKIPFAPSLEDDIKHRDQKDTNGAGDQHARKYRSTDVATADLRGAMREHEWD